MRVEIKTNGPVKDKDMRALYLIRHAVFTSSPHMMATNLKFIAEKIGYTLVRKDQSHA